MKLFQVDSFTSRLFQGNPAAVCLVDHGIEDELMQNIASEMNLSETAFVEIASPRVKLRWFTPRVEVDLCGHATLATAHILWEKGYFSSDQSIDFETRSGVLSASKSRDSIILDFPLIRTERIPVDPVYNQIFRTQILDAAKVPGDVVLEIPTVDHLMRVAPEMSEICEYSDQGIIITALGDEKYDFYSRYFVPNIGIDEDPVTGYAHCVLADYWSKKLDRNQFRAWQASKRGGELTLKVAGDRVLLGGRAVTVFETDLSF